MHTYITNSDSNLRSEDSVSSKTSSSPEITIDKSNSSPKSAIRRLYRKLSSRKGHEQQQSPTLGEANLAEQECCSDQIQRVFAYFDEDGDGKISAAELQSCVRTVGGDMTPEEAELAVRSSDSDGDGELGIEDFAKLMEERGEEERDGELKEAFGMYAMEGGECITPTSLKRMLSRLALWKPLDLICFSLSPQTLQKCESQATEPPLFLLTQHSIPQHAFRSHLSLFLLCVVGDMASASQASLLLVKQLRDLCKKPVDGFSAGLVDESNVFEWSVTIIGPPDTLYDGGYFHAIMSFPLNYPNSPPSVKFTSEMWHPNVYPDGRVCISILHPPGDDPNGYELASERWTPVHTVESIVLSIISMLSSPNDESPANIDAAKEWRDKREEFRKKVSRCVRRSQEMF